MIQQIRDNYLKDKIQTIVLNKHGIVLDSDDLLFPVEKNQSIENLHPFFEIGFIDLLNKNNNEEIFYCVHLNFEKINGSYDIYFNSGNTKTNPHLIIYDFTKRYSFFQTVAQEKNENVLNFRQEEVKNNQLQIEKAFKNKFLSNVSHNLRTPISAIIGFAEVLENTQLSVSQKDTLQTIAQTSQHLNGLIEDLLDISKIEAGKFNLKNKTFDFLNFAQQIEKTYLIKTLEKNLNFKLETDENIPQKIIADKVKLFQIFANIIDNAINFTKQGSINISISQKFKQADKIGLQIKIIDTGIGFDAKTNLDIFNSFGKLNEQENKGLGLGLNIVQEIVKQMAGTIKIISAPQKGTTVEINLTLKTDLTYTPKNKKIIKKEFLETDFKKPINILIADNNQTNQLLIYKLLSEHGSFNVDVVNNGQEALTASENNNYDAILMNLKMPVINGIEATKNIRLSENKAISKTPILGISANPTSQEKAICKTIGIKEYLPMPFTREELFLAIYKLLKNKKFS